MTLVAVGRAENRLMAIADTRIVSSNGILTEHGPKLLPIKVQGKQPGPSGGSTGLRSSSMLGSHILVLPYLPFQRTLWPISCWAISRG
jgi:hypothetical protein